MLGEYPSKKKKGNAFKALIESEEERDDEELALLTWKFKRFWCHKAKDQQVLIVSTNSTIQNMSIFSTEILAMVIVSSWFILLFLKEKIVITCQLLTDLFSIPD